MCEFLFELKRVVVFSWNFHFLSSKFRFFQGFGNMRVWYCFLSVFNFAGLQLIMPQAGQPLWLRCLIESFGCYWFVLWAFVSLKSVTWFCFVDNFQVDSANKRGSLLEVVQVLTDLNLLIRRAYISSDGEWFMDG